MKQEDNEDIFKLVDKIEDSSDIEQENQNDLQWQIAVAMAVSDLHGTDADKDKMLADRLNKFFLYDNKKDKSTYHFAEKPDFDRTRPHLEILHNKLLVYGGDYLKQRNIAEMFSLVQNEEVTFRNGSTFEINFKSPDSLKKSLLQLMVDPSKIDNLNDPQWLDLRPYVENGYQRKLQARLATNADIFKLKREQNPILKETKNKFCQQLQQKKESAQYPRRFNRHNGKPMRTYEIHEGMRQKPTDAPNHQDGNLSFRKRPGVVEVVDIDNGDRGSQRGSDTVNNYQHSMSLDISQVGSEVSHPQIYDEPRNTHKFSYPRYNREQEIREKQKLKEIKFVIIDE